MDRLEDILYELEGQIQPLEKQATVARRFLELDQERQVLLLDVLVAQVDLTKDLYEKADQEEKAIQEQLASYYQRRQVLEEDNVRIKKARHQLDESLAEDQASLLEVTRLISDLEKQIEVAKLQSRSRRAHSRRENLERLDAVLAQVSGRSETRAGSKTRDASCASTKADREPSATRRVGKRISQLRRRSGTSH